MQPTYIKFTQVLAILFFLCGNFAVLAACSVPALLCARKVSQEHRIDTCNNIILHYRYVIYMYYSQLFLLHHRYVCMKFRLYLSLSVTKIYTVNLSVKSSNIFFVNQY